MENTEIFIRLDADNIGEKIELSLYKQDFITANDTHNKVQLGISKIEDYLLSISNCEILMTGSDDILFKLPKNSFYNDVINEVSRIFLEVSRFTLSFGVGSTVIQAMHNLNIAKISGRNKVVAFNEFMNTNLLK